MISFDLILGIGLSVYLIYMLPDEQLKTIVRVFNIRRFFQKTGLELTTYRFCSIL